MIYTDGIIVAADTIQDLRLFKRSKHTGHYLGELEDQPEAIFYHLKSRYSKKIGKHNNVIILPSQEVMVKAKLCKYKQITENQDVEL